MNLTASLTYRCNSKCRTCNIHQRHANELTLEEWEKIFGSIGRAVFWITFSGGEPFLRYDVAEIVKTAYRHCQPAVINIPTNGLLHQIIPEKVAEIAQSCPRTQIIINLSIDEIGEKNDAIRGVKNSYEYALLTYNKIRKLSFPNLNIGIHTVISKFNCLRIPQIYETLQLLNPDSYITEIAEERVELQTIGSDITPNAAEYQNVVDFLTEKMRNVKYVKIGRITRAFRLAYYQIVIKILRENCAVIPCYSGIASAQIAPDGDVWLCCIQAKSIGNLREAKYSFKKVWRSEVAQKLRKEIATGNCFCPLANAAYTNMLLNYKTLGKIFYNLLRFEY